MENQYLSMRSDKVSSLYNFSTTDYPLISRLRTRDAPDQLREAVHDRVLHPGHPIHPRLPHRLRPKAALPHLRHTRLPLLQTRILHRPIHHKVGGKAKIRHNPRP